MTREKAAAAAATQRTRAKTWDSKMFSSLKKQFLVCKKFKSDTKTISDDGSWVTIFFPSSYARAFRGFLLLLLLLDLLYVIVNNRLRFRANCM